MDYSCRVVDHTIYEQIGIYQMMIYNIKLDKNKKEFHKHMNN